MRRSSYIILTLLLLISNSSRSGESYDPDSLLMAGEESYINGRYEQAIELWVTLAESGAGNAETEYNLGNAFFKTDDLASAILHWERALKLEPSHNDASYNLKLAATMLDDKIEPVPAFFLVEAYHSVVRLFNVQVWIWLSLSTLILAVVLFALFTRAASPGSRRVYFYSATLFLASALFAFIFALQGHRTLYNEDDAIIFAPTVMVKSSPEANGTDLFVIHAGTKVEIRDELQDWYRIRLADGSDGWVSASVLKII